MLRLFTDVRAGEVATALLLALNVFLLLSAYYVIKPVREALILAGGRRRGEDLRGRGPGAAAPRLVPLYGAARRPTPPAAAAQRGDRVLRRLPGRLLSPGPGRVAGGVPFFLWVGIFNLMIVAQFWSFANDLYTREQGERLFPIVAFGGSLGAVAGSVVAGALIPLHGRAAAAAGRGRASGCWPRCSSNRGGCAGARPQRGGPPARFTTAEIPAATGEYQVQERR